MDNRFNKVFPSFDPLNSEFSLSSRIIDIFSSCFSFHSFNKHSDDSLVSHIHQLDNLIITSYKDFLSTLIIMDTSIKGYVAMYIAHIYIHNKPVIKTLHHVVNITSTEAKLFTMRCGINQAISSHGILKIIVITDSIHSAKRIFDLSLYLFQIHVMTILSELRKFFTHSQENSIEFWECPS